MSSLDNVYRFSGGTPTQDNCPSSSTIESASLPAPPMKELTFSSYSAQMVTADSGITTSGTTELWITLSVPAGKTVREGLKVFPVIGGLRVRVIYPIVSADTVVVKIPLPDGMNLRNDVPVELKWVCPSLTLFYMRFNIRSKRQDE
jgi:hypothetical protein